MAFLRHRLRAPPRHTDPVPDFDPHEEITMIVCPACGLELRPSYMALTPIKNIDHPNGKCKDGGIGQVGVNNNAQQISKKQQKIMNTQAAITKNTNHHVQQSQKAMNTYQTQHKDPNVQATRTNLAGQNRLGGHSSQTSNSKQNNNTTGGLAAINKATQKK
jgi:hypothetical protein